MTPRLRPLAIILGGAGLLVVAAACSSPATTASPTVAAPSDAQAVETAAIAASVPAASIPAASASTAAPAVAASPQPKPEGPWVPEWSMADSSSRLNVLEEQVFIRNGGQVMLEDGLAVELFLDPYPPTTLRSWLDFYLTRDGEPVTDASMGIEYDMFSMYHGPFWGEAEKLGGGHYLFTLDYIMYGAWDQLVTVRYGGRNYRLPVVIVAYP
jgi:hypothetical protein